VGNLTVKMLGLEGSSCGWEEIELYVRDKETYYRSGEKKRTSRDSQLGRVIEVRVRGETLWKTNEKRDLISRV